MYADKCRNASENDLQEGDKVLVKQDVKNKLSTVFNPSQHTAVDKNGNSVTVESNQGVQYKSNITHIKKFNEKCKSVLCHKV